MVAKEGWLIRRQIPDAILELSTWLRNGDEGPSRGPFFGIPDPASRGFCLWSWGRIDVPNWNLSVLCRKFKVRGKIQQAVEVRAEALCFLYCVEDLVTQIMSKVLL